MESVLLSAVLVLVALLFVSSPSGKITSVERRLARLERKMDLLLDHFGVEEPPIPGMERVHELLRQGKKIEAIKVHRQLTGEGLKESKDAVERMS
ncbi:ribosomal protein L7/L12 [Streptomyces sp. NBC_00536]|uniref:ribosomal protein L7/L12 n=1 Tax=Streptomyces sp. NBC_00536 TaxID=2975769 RepID=UPI002E816D88|nr:ribosomal protein L7/L12 [Streptomyces sp. NBC_00536]WUC83329.1 ribosomal protein L7/L12 [Streptomyces sp. NBC_00536]